MTENSLHWEDIGYGLLRSLRKLNKFLLRLQDLLEKGYK